MKKLLFILSLMFCIVSCTENERARMIGGTATINLKPGEKLMMATWKGDGGILWYLVEPMDSDYVPKTKVLKECDPWGLPEGEVIFIETK